MKHARQKARARRSAGPAADRGPAERAQHGELLNRTTDIPGVIGKRARHECRLDWYWDKCSLVDRQHAAGIRFRGDWMIASAEPKLTGSYDLRVPGRESFSELQLAARRRVARALHRLSERARPVVIDVCCFDNWASGRLPELRDALTTLADHYRLPRDGD
jgi:hypothetical protein